MSSISSINSCDDIYTYGPPQLVGLWRIKNALQFGIAWRNKLYVSDKCVNDNIPEGLNWFNEKFERYDPIKQQVLKGAQRHSSPKYMKR